MEEGATTPAPRTGQPMSPLTPEQVKQIVRAREGGLTGQEINRIKAKARLSRDELTQLAKKHDEEQRKKNSSEVRVARKFMNYVEFGSVLESVSNLRLVQDEGLKGRLHGRRRQRRKERRVGQDPET
jgi:hypothetical protein